MHNGSMSEDEDREADGRSEPELDNRHSPPDVIRDETALPDAIRAAGVDGLGPMPDMAHRMTEIHAQAAKLFEPYLDLQKQLMSGPLQSAALKIADAMAVLSPPVGGSAQKIIDDVVASRLSSAFDLSDTIRQQTEASGFIQRMSEVAEAVASNSGIGALAANMRWVDQLTPMSQSLEQFAISSRIADEVVGPGALSSWRSALEAKSLIDVRLRADLAVSPLLSELAHISRVQVDLTDWAVQRGADAGLLTATSTWPVAEWRDLVSETVTDPDTLPMAVVTGRTNLSLLGSDLLTATNPDAGLAAESADRVESEIIEPWMVARSETFEELYAKLGGIDPKVPEMLKGAWDDVRRRGPAAAEKIANCTVEAVDRALRASAPDDAVRAWHSETNRPAKEWEGQNRPTRPLRVKFLLRNLDGPGPVVESQSAAFATMASRLQNNLQGVKHASQADVTALRALLAAAESLLISLFLI